MPKQQKALIDPAMLAWARTSAKMSKDELAKRLGVDRERITAWESGDKQPTVRQARELAKKCGWCFAVLYLPEPPKDFQAIKDFRRVHGHQPDDMTHALTLEIREILAKREIALELYQQLEVDPPNFDPSLDMNGTTQQVGSQIRKLLGIDDEEQRAARPGSASFRLWREAIESVGVLVFQGVGVSVSEMRGLSISVDPLPVVVVNRKDSYAGRIFTLIHEFSHLLLRSGGICMLREGAAKSAIERIEVRCNALAGEVLVPADSLLHEKEVAAGHKGEWSNDQLKSMANRYGVSKEMVLRRLLTLGRTTQAHYEEKRREFLEEYEELAKMPRKGFVTPPINAISAAGKPFARLVLEALSQNKIPTSSAASYLGTRSKHFGEIERLVFS